MTNNLPPTNIEAEEAIHRDDYYNSDTDDPGMMEIIVSKNRNGSTGTCEVTFNPSVGRFNNRSESQNYPSAS